MANPTYLSKNLIAASSTGIGTFSSGAASLGTINSSNLGTGRRIQIAASSGSESGATFTVTGTREGGTALSETITGPTSNVAVATTQDFLTVTSVISSSAINSQVIVGTNTQGGTPWQLVNIHVTEPIQIGGALVFSSTANSMVAQIDLTMDNPFTFTPSGTPGGMPVPVNAVPISFISTAFSSGTGGNTLGQVNAVGNAMMPITAWRLTLTSSSSGAGTVNFAAVQAGIG